MFGLPGPVVPSLITGALKLMLGIFAGGAKFGGKLPVRLGCALACELPGAGPTPGADRPGGPTSMSRARFEDSLQAYPFRVEPRVQEMDWALQEIHHTLVVFQMTRYL